MGSGSFRVPVASKHMETPADQRLLELLDKWLKSLDLHIKYASLDDESYWKVQPWAEHQRPNLWIINLAKQKAVALRKQVQERIKSGDSQFSDALEQMSFLANLVGSEHIERFIPMAEAEREIPLPRKAPAPRTAAADRPPNTGDTATLEMPKLLATRRQTPPPLATATVARSERKSAAQKPAAKAPAKPAPQPKSGSKTVSDEARDQVIEDAARLMKWGRKWYEIAELIARMADRPSLPDVRRIIKDNKAAIDKMSGRS
jgi:hypothetical protein